MATLCPRCGTHERTLESLGVFRCPACGRVNADGELIPEGASEPARFAVRTGEGSFAAPPPVAPPAIGTRAPFPTLALVLIVVQAFLTLLELASSGGESFRRTLFRGACLGGLVIGDRTSYRAACAGWFVTSIWDAVSMMTLWPSFGLVGHVVLVGVLVLDAAFLAVLLSRDMRERYEKPAVA